MIHATAAGKVIGVVGFHPDHRVFPAERGALLSAAMKPSLWNTLKAAIDAALRSDTIQVYYLELVDQRGRHRRLLGEVIPAGPDNVYIINRDLKAAEVKHYAPIIGHHDQATAADKG